VRVFSELPFTAQFILLCFGIILVYFFVTAFQTKRTVERAGGQWRFVLLALAIGVAVRVLQNRVLPPTNALLLPHTLAVQILADAITFCGLIVMLWARTVLGGNWSGRVTFKEDHELIERGPYAYVRHPIYSGSLLMVLGAAIFWSSMNALGAFAICFIGFWSKSRIEEKLLTAHFPVAYPEYKSRTKALIPFVL
jgi:protein-S-isoprenylcysteine O-methyltransferase Ste14